MPDFDTATVPRQLVRMDRPAPNQDSAASPAFGSAPGLAPGAMGQLAGSMRRICAPRGGGTIPELEGVPAYLVSFSEPSPIPVLIAVPHAGRAYPPSLVARMRNPAFAALRLEDRYVDRLAQGIAEATGAALITAQAPRAMLDLNRAPDDIDWEMVARARDGEASVLPPARPLSGRSRSGLGLIPRRLPGIGELWKARHPHSELEARIAGIHTPYHTALAQTLSALRERWGAALLVDLHSMPPLVWRGGPAPEFVIGDRFGATCSGALVGGAFAWLGQARRLVAHNRPYAGGYVLERHANPGSGIHALQIEIDRTSYLDSRLAELGSGFGPMISLLSGLVRQLASEVAELGQAAGSNGWAEAAE